MLSNPFCIDAYIISNSGSSKLHIIELCGGYPKLYIIELCGSYPKLYIIELCGSFCKLAIVKVSIEAIFCK